MKKYNKKDKKGDARSWLHEDPFQARESERYVAPIPSREYILKVLSDVDSALELEDLLLIFELRDEKYKDALRRRLRAMERESQIVITDEGTYRPFIEGQDQAREKEAPAFKLKEVQVNLESAAQEAIEEHHLPHEWPEALLKEIQNLSLKIPEHEIKKRRDLRDLPLVTIDGEDAKDFDDAVYCERLGSDHRLIVAIADVSFYVRPSSFLDMEASMRGNSVYFPGRVIPMLPEILSNELCSLKPQVDRLCLVADMRIDAHGRLLEFEFYEAVMRSQARLTYTTVAQVLEAPELIAQEPFKQFHHVWAHVFDLYELFKILYRARDQRGALDFDTVEGRLVLNEKGEIREIKPVVRNDAHRLIEEAMLIANVAAAQFIQAGGISGIYRIHEGLREERYPDLKDFLNSRGLKLGIAMPSAKALNEILKKALDRPDYSVLQTVVLRSMTQAVYSTENKGHYGLAYEAYTHFTSPIRRYPDLLVHRLIRKILSKTDPAGCTYAHEDLNALCVHTSNTERRADEASRDVVLALKCGYLQRHLGQEFSGIISGVTHFGLFVTLEDLLVDGLVHVTSLPSDYYEFDPAHHRLQGERSGRVFQIGQELKVKIVKVDPLERKVDFLLAGYEAPRRRFRSKKSFKK